MRLPALLCALALTLSPAIVRSAPAGMAPIAETRPAPALAAALAMPMASGLVGARDVPRFAWVETVAGVRNIWVADRGSPARQVTRLTEDDGEELYDLALSADGRRIAYVRGGDGEWPDDAAPNAAGALMPVGRQLFVQSLDGDAPAIRVGTGGNPVFSPDGTRIAFANGKELWLWDGTAARIARVDGSVERVTWSPDGTRIAFVDNRRDHSFMALLDLTPARLRYLDAGPDFATEPAFSRDGQRIAFIRYVDPPTGTADDSGPYWSLRVADPESGATRVLWSASVGAGARYYGTRSANLFWSADGRIIFPSEASGWVHPYAIEGEKGGQPVDLTPGEFEVENYVLDRAGKAIVYAGNAEDIDRRHVWRRPLDGRAERLTGGRGIESYPTIAGDALAVIATDARMPARAMIVANGTLTPLRPDAGAWRAAAGFVDPEPVIFTTADGVTIHAQLLRAKGVTGKRPALVFIHGGPRRQMLLGFVPSGYYAATYILNQHFAAQGYDVLIVNYRSGTGYGRAFRDAPETGRGGASEYRDIFAAGHWLASQPQVDAARIGVWGGSWGGYLTALALARDSDLFAGGVDLHGVHTLLRTVPDTLSPDAQLAARRLQWTSSPMGAIDRWRSPVLLIHGDDDYNVPFSQTVLLARELAARGIPHRTIAFPNERHSFLRHANWLTALAATDIFLGETVMRHK
jgi:dipeptidyl aminopeptidase/acylaminoacyl peptidase